MNFFYKLKIEIQYYLEIVIFQRIFLDSNFFLYRSRVIILNQLVYKEKFIGGNIIRCLF